MPRQQGQRLNAAERREKAEQACSLAIARQPYRQIAEELDISEPTVVRLIKEEQQRAYEQKDAWAERDKAIATYEMVIRKATRMLAQHDLGAHAMNRPALLNVIIQAQHRIDDITGIKMVGANGEDKAASDFLEGARTMRQLFEEKKANGSPNTT